MNPSRASFNFFAVTWFFAIAAILDLVAPAVRWLASVLS